MMNKPIFLALLLLLAISLSGAQTLNERYLQMQKTYGRLSSWQAAIRQTNYFFDTKASLVSSGSFHYQKGRIDIRYAKPSEQVLLVEAGKVTVYDASSNTVIKSRITTDLQSLDPVQIIKTYWQKSEKKLLSSKDAKAVIKLRPKNDKQLKELIFTLNSKTGYVMALTYTDTGNNSVTIEFTSIKVNKTIPASVWKLDIPKGAQVIER